MEEVRRKGRRGEVAQPTESRLPVAWIPDLACVRHTHTHTHTHTQTPVVTLYFEPLGEKKIEWKLVLFCLP